ncbi:MAG TPA: hypothetical protein ENK48_03305 [Gammaproteobacteria bacterium]|nr:hypothetical protein [Gammaproteobacteria bacterium]
MNRRRRHRGLRLRSLFLWHRYLGLAAALFVVVLSVTGLLLNHAQRLALDKRYVQAGPILDWYGIRAPAVDVAFHAGGHWVSRLGERIYLDERLLLEDAGPLVGFVALRDFMVVAVEGKLLLLAPDGALVERLGGAEGVPAGMKAMGVDAEGRLVARASHGDYVVDEDFLRWRDLGRVRARWSRPQTLPAPLYQRLAALYRSTDVTLERLLLDLHSGRLLGSRGPWLMDGAALLLLGLATTGVWHWARRRR